MAISRHRSAGGEGFEGHSGWCGSVRRLPGTVAKAQEQCGVAFDEWLRRDGNSPLGVRLQRPYYLVDVRERAFGQPREERAALGGLRRRIVTHATAVDLLPPIHKDPFDRLLVAQAQIEGMTLLTMDEIVASYPGPIWAF